MILNGHLAASRSLTTVAATFIAVSAVLILPAAANAFDISRAKLTGGEIEIRGTAAPRNAVIVWENEVVARADRKGKFSFATNIVPDQLEGECVAKGRLVAGHQSEEVLVKLCPGNRGRRGKAGPRGIAGPSGPSGTTGPQGVPGNPLEACHTVHARRDVGVSVERSESVSVSCEADELLTGGGCASAPAFDSRESSHPDGQAWVCTVTAMHGPEVLPYGSLESWAICCD